MDEARGALVVVYRRGERGLEYLILHRGHSGPTYEGDWAWGPPGGARAAGESVDACARRELLEETGLALGCAYLWLDESGWPVYAAEAPAGSAVRLSEEHDRFAWLPLAEATARVTPPVVRAQFARAARHLEGRTSLDPAERARVAERVLARLAEAVPGSRAELRGSLAEGTADAYSDVDVLWIVPDEAFAAGVQGARAALEAVGPVESLRSDPDWQRSPRRRLLFVRFADLPLFWRLDLDVRAASACPDEPPARGEDWSPAESALANAVAAVKAELRAHPAEAAALLGRAFDRVGLPRVEGATRRRIAALAAAVTAAEPALARLAARITALADRHLSAR